jgi:hypothetical protein
LKGEPLPEQPRIDEDHHPMLPIELQGNQSPPQANQNNAEQDTPRDDEHEISIRKSKSEIVDEEHVDIVIEEEKGPANRIDLKTIKSSMGDRSKPRDE